MHSASQSVFWPSILASALVASVVTLLIEYVAKPRLEARKARILDADQRKREAIYGLRRAVELVSRLGSFTGAKELDEPATQERMKKWAGEVEQLVETAYLTIEAPKSLRGSWMYLNGYVTGFMAHMQSEKLDLSTWKGLSSTFNDLSFFLSLFTTSRWHWRQRRTLVKHLIELDAIRRERKKSKSSDVKESQSKADLDGDKGAVVVSSADMTSKELDGPLPTRDGPVNHEPD